ncbi:MAG TPA: hypothetical protein DCZ95_06740 [Verrucomicrobia bacterium]|nr:MAG: hypothetical protein A2X46_10615 [Lentisphaerae bacterium GWF2_57_35]HBA83774.1 hypothetical protein [Verrucomicrobiota bacterium]
MRFPLRRFSVFVVFFGLFSSSAPAVIRYVWTNSPSPGSGYTTWSTAAHEIQQAIDASTAGDLILVTNGLYDTGGRAVGVITNRVALNKAIRVVGLNGAANTIIKGQWNSQWYGHYGPEAVRCAYVGSNAVLQNFTLTNGYTGTTTEPLQDQCGGGAFCESNGVLVNCVVKNSQAASYGGGIYGGIASNCTIYYCRMNSYGGGAADSTLISGRVELCSAPYGGGMYRGYAKGCLFVSNDAYYAGGGMYAGGSSYCTFLGNKSQGSSDQGGGGVSQGHHYNGAFTLNVGEPYGGAAFQSDLHGCSISNNWGENGGGAAYSTASNCDIVGNSAPFFGAGSYYSQLTDCRVNWNRAGTNMWGDRFGSGGGLYEGSALRSVITFNDALVNGGGACDAYLTNCTVSYNTATNENSRGGGLAGGTAAACLLANNQAHYGGGASGALLIGCTNRLNSAGYTNYSACGGGGGAYECTLRGCLVSQNGAQRNGRGGGLFGGSANDCRIVGNNAFNVDSGGTAGGAGGGAYGSSLTNCLIVRNSAMSGGGGAYSSLVVHCTIVSNMAYGYGMGGGTYAGTAICSIVYYNISPSTSLVPDGTNYAGTALISCCTTNRASLPAGNITAEPQFTETDLFLPASNSPCIDAATNSACGVDYFGIPRPLDGNNDRTAYWDIGAHEYVHPSADSDLDGMNDVWEMAYALNPIVNDAALDKDGDRLDNYGEFRAGTDPTDADSFLGLAGAATAGSGLAVSWSSVAGKLYRLNRCQELTAGAWTAVVSGIVGVSPMNTATDITAVGSGPWSYRIELE